MTLTELKEEVKKIMYIEDDGIIEVTIASIVANSIAKTSPVWLTLIGNSSAGKSQFIRPIADANPELIHKLDTPTPNAFLSGANGGSSFLLDSVKDKGIILFSDLTVLFSMSSEARGEVLSIMRMIYDGEYTKKTGTKVLKWKGYAGVLSASTPSIYSYLAEVADMGERFIYYRMKPVDQMKLQDFVVGSNLSQNEMDEKLTDLYQDYIGGVMASLAGNINELTDKVRDRLYTISYFGAKLRSPVHVDYQGNVDRIPQMESPVRVYKQLETVANAMMAMAKHDGREDLSEEQIQSLEWCAYSLGNEERRTILKSVVEADSHKVTARDVSAYIGLDTDVVKRYLTELTSIGMLKLHSRDESSDNALRWSVANDDDIKIITRLDTFTEAKAEVEDDEDEPF